MGRAVALVEVVGGADPLHGPLDVRSPAARGDRAATDQHDRVEIPALAGEGGGHRLIKQSCARLDISQLDERGTNLAHRTQGQIGVATLPSEVQRLTGTALGNLRLSLVVGEVRPAQQHPAPHRRQLELLDELGCPSCPAASSGVVAQTHAERETQVDRAEHSLPRLGLPSEHGVGALPTAQRLVGVTGPPASDPEPEQRLPRLDRLEHTPVDLLRNGPLARPQRLITRLDQLVEISLHYTQSYEPGRWHAVEALIVR